MSSDDYQTDVWLMELFKDWYDPCPYKGLEDGKDGLLEDWQDRTFVNPPYSNPMAWVKKAIYENKTHGHTIVMLLKHDSSTYWYAALKEYGARFLWINGRLKHRTKSAASFASMLVILTACKNQPKDQTRFDL